MRNPLQDQLLKAGLAKKGKLAQVVREQTKQRHAKGVQATDADKVDTAQLHAERVERDRQIAAERNAQARQRELQAQVRQIIDMHKLPDTGEIPYAFDDAGRIKRIHVDAAQRTLLTKGALVVARHGDGYVLLPRAAADKVLERDPAGIALDHRSRNAGETTSQVDSNDDDAFYARFKVPDDLVW
ncbi:DUF2058 domain-containing protein [Thermomonas sp.]|uniref:DUF2058 domain-containing protein n=1 Tax=Thermomonas sp. TaxID=1971895 RepID=UPI002489A13E|nr:DUF2058 domain-containing protein [Thermomonas sp.]MDI1253956.1 DUF2058 domain-containing protein [Thermomonas sp.]